MRLNVIVERPGQKQAWYDGRSKSLIGTGIRENMEETRTNVFRQ